MVGAGAGLRTPAAGRVAFVPSAAMREADVTRTAGAALVATGREGPARGSMVALGGRMPVGMPELLLRAVSTSY